MTVTQIAAHASADVTPQIALPGPRVRFLAQRVVRAVTVLGGEPTDLAARRVVDTVVECFIASGGRPSVAAAQTRELMEELGALHYREGHGVDEINRAFAAAHRVVLGTLNHVIGDSLRGDPMLMLRLHIKEYLHLLCLNMLAGLRAEESREHRDHAQRRALLADRAHGHDDTPPSRAGMVRAMVAVREPFSEALLADPRVIRRSSQFEVLLAESVEVGDIEPAVTRQAVVGPLTSWGDLADSLNLVWRAARLLADRWVRDDRLLVPCADLIGDLLVAGNPVMTELLAHKHLGVFDGMSEARRNDLATTLLHWLESGLPANQLARTLGVAPQTLHSRIARLRELFGTALEDPRQRLELTVALRAVLPRWTA